MKARLVVALVRHRLDPLAGVVGDAVLRTLAVEHQTGGRLGHPANSAIWAIVIRFFFSTWPPGKLTPGYCTRQAASGQ